MNFRHACYFVRLNATLFEGFSSEEQDLAFSLFARMQVNAENALEKDILLE